MPQQAWTKKRERQYKHIKKSLLERGRGDEEAEEIAARTVNKERRTPVAQRSRRENIRPALRGGQRSQHQGPLRDEQRGAQTGGGPENRSIDCPR